MIELVKEILRYYSKIDNMAEKLDRLINNTAVNSFKSLCESAAEHISVLIEKKVKLINLKCIIKNSTETLCAEKKEIAYSYMKGKHTKSLLQNRKICERTVFRRIEKTLAAVAATFRQSGFDESFFLKEYSDFKFVTKYLEIKNSAAENGRDRIILPNKHSYQSL